MLHSCYTDEGTKPKQVFVSHACATALMSHSLKFAESYVGIEKHNLFIEVHVGNLKTIDDT